jgi:hypothetical protein
MILIRPYPRTHLQGSTVRFLPFHSLNPWHDSRSIIYPSNDTASRLQSALRERLVATLPTFGMIHSFIRRLPLPAGDGRSLRADSSIKDSVTGVIRAKSSRFAQRSSRNRLSRTKYFRSGVSEAKRVPKPVVHTIPIRSHSITHSQCIRSILALRVIHFHYSSIVSFPAVPPLNKDWRSQGRGVDPISPHPRQRSVTSEQA